MRGEQSGEETCEVLQSHGVESGKAVKADVSMLISELR